MKKYLIFTLLILQLFSCKKNENLTYSNGATVCFVKYENGSLNKIVTLQNGLLNGPSITYRRDNSIKSLVTFKNGERQGWKMDYDSLGKLIEMREYVLIGKESKLNQELWLNRNGNIELKQGIFFNVHISKINSDSAKLNIRSIHCQDFPNIRLILSDFNDNFTQRNSKSDTIKFDNFSFSTKAKVYNGRIKGILQTYKYVNQGKEILSRAYYFDKETN